jgi:histidine triad (HIT) family protein
MDPCPFCAIAAGSRDAVIVCQDERTVAFLDHRPINTGHVLVISRIHEPDFYQLPDDDYKALMHTVRRVAIAVARTFHPQKVGMVIAGFDVSHTHIHVIPMHHYDDITSRAYIEKAAVQVDRETMRSVAKMLQSAVPSLGSDAG